MDEAVVKGKLIEVLKVVQELSNESWPASLPTISGPVASLPEFTSKVWPVAAGMLGLALGKSIPCDVNILRRRKDEDSAVHRADCETGLRDHQRS